MINKLTKLKNKFLVEPSLMEAMIMAQTGFSLKYIAQETKLSSGRIRYHYKILGIKLTDFRNGKTHFSVKVRNNTRILAESYIRKSLKQIES